MAQANAHPPAVALLRGINVGGKNKLPMKELAKLFEAAGASDVRTYIQSGNVVFRAKAPLDELGLEVERRIAQRHGLRVPVILRTAAELVAVARHNPFLRGGEDTQPLHVVFLAAEPASKDAARLDPNRSPPDELILRGKELYLRCPNGVGQTRLTNAYFDSTLKTISTSRNWRTVLKLIELSSD